MNLANFLPVLKHFFSGLSTPYAAITGITFIALYIYATAIIVELPEAERATAWYIAFGLAVATWIIIAIGLLQDRKYKATRKRQRKLSQDIREANSERSLMEASLEKTELKLNHEINERVQFLSQHRNQLLALQDQVKELASRDSTNRLLGQETNQTVAELINTIDAQLEKTSHRRREINAAKRFRVPDEFYE